MFHKKQLQVNTFFIIFVFTAIAFSVIADVKTEEVNHELINATDSLISENTSDTTLTNVDSLLVPDGLSDIIINFNLTSEIYYTKFSQFKTEEGKGFFVDGWKNSQLLNELISETDSLRNEYAKSNFSDNKTSIANRVIELEKHAFETKSVADFNFMKASEFELNYWKQTPEIEKFQLLAENDSIKSIAENKTLIEMSEEIFPDSISSDIILSDSMDIQKEKPGLEPVKTGKIIFKVQIGAYNTELPESANRLFKKISTLRKIDQYIDDRNFTIYTIGELTNIKDAVRMQEQIRQESIKDAFIIAFKDGKRIPLNEAMESTK